MTGQQVLLDDVNFELAKAAAELDVPFIAEALAAKEHDDVVVEDALQLAEGLVVDRPGQVEADLGAERRVAFPNWDRHWPACHCERSEAIPRREDNEIAASPRFSQ